MNHGDHEGPDTGCRLCDQDAPPRSRFAEYRDRQRGGPPRVPAEHGTIAAARRHQRHGGTAELNACPLCAPVWREHQAEMYRKRTGGSGIP